MNPQCSTHSPVNHGVGVCSVGMAQSFPLCFCIQYATRMALST